LALEVAAELEDDAELDDDELLAGGGGAAVVGGAGAPPPGGTARVTPESDGSTQKLMLPDSIARRST
jgi:hypothetical protein